MRLRRLMARLTKIDPGFGRLLHTDSCWHIGEFQSHGGWQAGETNSKIKNLKIFPVPAHRKQYKDAAVRYWAEKLKECLNAEVLREQVTLVPAPCSKPRGHAEHDDRMVRVLSALNALIGPLDIREAVVTHTERPAQHRGEMRLSPSDLQRTMCLDPTAFRTPLRPVVLVVDDVFTRGSTFRAIKGLLEGQPNVREVGGVFLARTVWRDEAVSF